MQFSHVNTKPQLLTEKRPFALFVSIFVNIFSNLCVKYTSIMLALNEWTGRDHLIIFLNKISYLNLRLY